MWTGDSDGSAWADAGERPSRAVKPRAAVSSARGKNKRVMIFEDNRCCPSRPGVSFWDAGLAAPSATALSGGAHGPWFGTGLIE
jgi:hypothetical protein